MMNCDTAEKIIGALAQQPAARVELTGGAPELNPGLKNFIEKISAQGKQITVRTNLTSLVLPECSFYPDLYKAYKVKLVASLPCYGAENVDRQRGEGVFQTSIEVLQRLNRLGYGTNGLKLDLVYNPLAEFLPPEHAGLEHAYKEILRERYGVAFNGFIAMANVPIGRFKEALDAQKKYGDYMSLLQQCFNPATVGRLMCRALLSVNYQGYVYDCDFNLALDKKIKDYEDARFWEIDFSCFAPEISFGEHCSACTAGCGSSCHGALVAEEVPSSRCTAYEHSVAHL
jgi:radical SAM/Cys-rich protein